MFDFGLSELLLVGIVALIVLGPERLPEAARGAGRLFGKIQKLAAGVRQEFDTQAELAELRKAKQEFEAAAEEMRAGLHTAAQESRQHLDSLSDGLKPWERLPVQRTPADFGLDGQGRALHSTEPDAGTAWHSHTAEQANWPAVSEFGLHPPSLHKQAMQRKRDRRPKARIQPKLRIRKK